MKKTHSSFTFRAQQTPLMAFASTSEPGCSYIGTVYLLPGFSGSDGIEQFAESGINAELKRRFHPDYFKPY